VEAYEHPQLDALGDGTRRAILARLLAEGPMAVGDIAYEFHVSRPAVSQHLRILKHAHLVRDEQQGTRRVYELDPHGFQLLQQYFDQFWTEALLAFKHQAEATAPKKTPRTQKPNKRSSPRKP
jgi:DNA-binding transcriptional ArsR family regulator